MYDWGGDCKHIVALLLTCLREPERFQQPKTLRDELRSRQKTELLDIGNDMIARYPGLEKLAERAANAGFADQRIDLPAIKRELKAALRDRGLWMDRTAEYKVCEIASLGDRYAGRGDYVQAIAIYSAILETCNASEYPTDDEGQYVDAVNSAVDSLQVALSHLDLEQHEDLRRRLLGLLVGAVIWDIDYGGIGYANVADEMIMEIAQPADTPRIRERIRWAEESNKTREFLTDWAPEDCERFLMLLDQIDMTDPEATLARLQAKEQHYLYASLSLDLKRYEQAAAAIAKLQPANGLRRGLDLLVEHQQIQTAIKLAEAALEKEYNSRLAGWLVDLLRNQGDKDAEFRWQLNRMRLEPQINNYIGLREAAEAVGCWGTARPKVIGELKRNETYVLLAEVYSHDEEWDLAWDALGKVYQGQTHRRSVLHRGVDFAVAEKSRHARPARAIPVYVAYARGQIDRRSRQAYANAAELLQEVRKLHQQMNDSAGWQKLIADLRREFARLPALQDELDKAGL